MPIELARLLSLNYLWQNIFFATLVVSVIAILLQVPIPTPPLAMLGADIVIQGTYASKDYWFIREYALHMEGGREGGREAGRGEGGGRGREGGREGEGGRGREGGGRGGREGGREGEGGGGRQGGRGREGGEGGREGGEGGRGREGEGGRQGGREGGREGEEGGRGREGGREGLEPRLHWSSNQDSIHFQSQTESQSTSGCGLSQSGSNLDWWAFTLDMNPGECGLNTD